MNKLILQGLLYCSLLFLSTMSSANNQNNKAQFNNAFSQHQQLISKQQYQEALPFAKQAYDLANEVFEPLSNNRLVATDNYALNLQITNNLPQARAVFIELLALYDQKYGKQSVEVLPILTDIVSLNKQLESDVDADEAKSYAVRRYKLYLRHYSDEFVQQFSDLDLPTTIHAENTVDKLRSHLGKDFAIYESEHWSIIYPPQKLKYVKNKMAKLMEETYKNNISFLVSLGLRNKPIKEKMTAVYFANRADYKSYIKMITGDSDVANFSGGVYSPRARSLFIFGYENTKKGKRKSPKEQTIVHEASHQVLYATGFHSVHYIQPRWLKEGAAVSFEHHTVKQPFGPHTSNYSFNRIVAIKMRFENGALISLHDLITFDGDEEGFSTFYNQSDIYALGSILIRFLYLYYPNEFKDYLTILSKSRTISFGSNIRLKQFKKAFGQPEMMQAQFTAYIEKVIDETDAAYAEYLAKKKAKNKRNKK